MKRTLSDSDTDEIFDESIKGSPSQSCPVTARKKRRGIIEKRRRDRINNSLTELRRLVPAAYEKQGSAKLEKAEILQMTVDHLKYLHAKGIDGSFHPYGEAHAYAMDYRVLGFRECASEVARYMVTVEGMDIQDPLRLRLMSHLQCYMAQREFQSRQHYSHSHSQFSSHAAAAAAHGQTGVALPHGQQHPAAAPTADPASSSASHGTSIPSGVQIPETTTSGRQMIPMITSSSQEASSLTSCHARLPMPPSTGASVPINSSVSAQITPPVAPIQSLHTQYPGVTYNSLPVLSPNGFSPTSSSHMTHSTLVSKPYRPWGAEMAY